MRKILFLAIIFIVLLSLIPVFADDIEQDDKLLITGVK